MSWQLPARPWCLAKRPEGSTSGRVGVLTACGVCSQRAGVLTGRGGAHRAPTLTTRPTRRKGACALTFSGTVHIKKKKLLIEIVLHVYIYNFFSEYRSPILSFETGRVG